MKPNTVVLQRDNSREEVNIDRIKVTRAPLENRTPLDNIVHQEQREGTDEYVMDKLEEHHTNEDGTMEFKIRWIGSNERTWEPVSHLPYSAIARYCSKRNLPLPVNINDARNG